MRDAPSPAVAGTGSPKARAGVAAVLASRLNGPPPAGSSATGPQRLALLHNLPPGSVTAPANATADPDLAPPAADLYVAADPTNVPADELLSRLRWGGLLVTVAPSRGALAARRTAFAGSEWQAEGDPVRLPPWPLKPSGILGPVLGFPGRPAWAQAWRKVRHEPFDRPSLYHHSFDVRLHRDPGEPSGHRVVKQVPSHDQIRRRLARHAEAGGRAMHADLDRAARKLCNKIFPVFLTREAAFLKIVAEKLANETQAGHFPRVLDVEKDERGFVRRIDMSWLRLGGAAMSGFDFVRGAAELVDRLHTDAKIAHLDLRLDNFVITDAGVCLVDFGSAVRLGERFDTGGLLDVLLSEMLSASRIHQDLRRLQEGGRVTSRVFDNAYDPPGRAVDLYSLTQNLSQLRHHREFNSLVSVREDERTSLSRLRRRILRPSPADAFPPVSSVEDLLRVLDRVEESPSTLSRARASA